MRLSWRRPGVPSPSTVATGRAAETEAQRFLRARGYRILQTNFRCRVGEIDIVARHGDALVFAEVRSRSSARFGTAADAVTPAKRRQVAAVARAYLAIRRPRYRSCRFDVVAITGDQIELIPDAFRLGELA